MNGPRKGTMDNRSARLLNRRGEPLPIEVPVTEKPDGAGFAIAVDVGLAPLAQGDYVIELTATAGSDKIQKLLAFRIVEVRRDAEEGRRKAFHTEARRARRMLLGTVEGRLKE